MELLLLSSCQEEFVWQNSIKCASKGKKNKQSSDSIIDDGKPNEIDSEKGDSKTASAKDDAACKEKKGSKKRKRVASEEDAGQLPGDKQDEGPKHRETEESKRRKKDSCEESKTKGQSTQLQVITTTEGKTQKEESSQVGLGDCKQINGQPNGNLEENEEKSSIQSTMKKKQNGSAEVWI